MTPSKETMDLLPFLHGLDRERLLTCLRSGKISDDQFTAKVSELHLAELTQQMRVLAPELSFSDPKDHTEHQSNVAKFLDTINGEDSVYRRVLWRAENMQETVENIFDDWSTLRRLTKMHYEALVKRWMKRTIPQRKKTLLEAWPDMSLVHRPDFEVIRRGLRGPDHRDALMMPYINCEDLSLEKNLLEFMRSRSQMSPEHFAWSDSLPYKAAEAMGAVLPAAQYEQLMLLSGQSRETYGQLKDITYADTENIVWTGYGLQLGHGIVILDTQQRLYRFLVRCAQLLLHDMDLSTGVVDAASLRSQDFKNLSCHMSIKNVEWQSVSKMNSEAYYRLPQRFSLKVLERLASTQCDAAEDVFWTLHEDPGYFQEQLALKYHQALVHCRKIPGPSRTPEEDVLMNATVHLIFSACQDIILWDAIRTDLRSLVAFTDGMETGFRLDARLPPDYEKAMESFIALILLAFRIAIKSISGVMMSNPKLGDFFEMIPAVQGGRGGYTYRLKRSSAKIPTILSLLHDLGTLKDMMGSLNIMDEMERIMSSDPTQRDIVDTNMNIQISKLAALAQIDDALGRHQPKIQATLEDSPSVLRHHMVRLDVINDVERHLHGTSLGQYTKPRSAFVYPVGKKPTPQHIEQMRRAEAKLDAFWDHVDTNKFKPRTGKTLLEWLGDRITIRNVRRTQPWQPDAQKLPRPAPLQTYQPFPSSTPATIDKLPTKPVTKQKTRGETSSSTTEPAEPTTIPEITMPQLPTFALPRRMYKTMTTLFPSSVEDRESRHIHWKDFLHAMYSLQFRIEKRHGSEWYFEPTWKRNAPITIHEPHPSHETRFDKIRFEANRMARKYGWSYETFALDA
ncbi:MAG: hypothetical protein Q9218_004270 [Villophora microphyllina]